MRLEAQTPSRNNLAAPWSKYPAFCDHQCLSASFSNQKLSYLRRDLACFTLMSLLFFPLLPLPSSDAQSVGTKWKVELTTEVEGPLITISEKMTGEVEVIQEPFTGVPILNGTGKATWTYRHHETESCAALSGVGEFGVTFIGAIRRPSSGNDEGFFISLQGHPGDGPYGGKITPWDLQIVDTVDCHNEDSSWTEARQAVPERIELGNPLDEWIKGFTVKEDREDGTYVNYGKLLPPDVVYRVYGTVRDSSGNVLSESKLVIADFKDLGSKGGAGFLQKLSTLKPNFEDSSTASESGAEYEFKLQRPPNEPFSKFLVVSVLWYDGKPEFAVTNGDETGGRYVPVYQALCVDHIEEGGCVKWEPTEKGYEAKVDFVYGKKASHTDSFMEREDWQKGSGSLDGMMEGAGFTYYNTYLGVKHVEKLGLGFSGKPFMIKTYHTKDTCAEKPTSAFYWALTGSSASNFGGLGSSLETAQAQGGGIYICHGDSAANGRDAPFNREWHELGHYILYNLYSPRDGTQYTNHAGYANDSTNDSFIEGFAEFFSMLTKEHYAKPEPWKYPVGGHSYNLEEDIKVWGAGIDEEFAVAGILWDLHDSGVETNQGFVSDDGYVGAVSRVYNQTTDKVSQQGSEIIKAVQTSRVKTLVGTYVALLPSVSSEDLDMIFLNHGAFADISERNYIHDAWNETISQTGNTANRMVRFSPVPELPGSYIVADATALLEVAFRHVEPFGQYDYSYTVNLTASEPAYFSMPPPYYPSKAVFSQLSEDGTVLASNITSIDSAEYWSYIDSSPSENATFRTIQVSEIVPVSSSDNSPPPETTDQPAPAQPGGGGCLIATAAFGSELTPQVQFLRNFRDHRILDTTSGSSFMSVFNSWYYSFSPAVADYERQQPWLQQTVRIAIYPLLGILQMTEKAYALVPGEFGSITAGIVASSLIGAVYFSPIALSIKQVRTKRIDYRLAILVIAALLASTLVALLAKSTGALMVTTALLVVSALSISAIYSGGAIWSVIQLWKRLFRRATRRRAAV